MKKSVGPLAYHATMIGATALLVPMLFAGIVAGANGIEKISGAYNWFERRRRKP